MTEKKKNNKVRTNQVPSSSIFLRLSDASSVPSVCLLFLLLFQSLSNVTIIQVILSHPVPSPSVLGAKHLSKS